MNVVCARLRCILLWIVISCVSMLHAQPGGESSASVVKARPFDRANVELLPGPFCDARELNLQYLLELEPDRLLHSYRKEAGLQPKGAIYGGWESKQIAGTALAHYLTALSMEYRSSREPELLRRIRYIVDELETCQQHHQDGYLAGIPGGRRVFGELTSGTVVADQTNLNGSWAPWYVIHKIMSGLRDAWQLAGIEKARPMLIRMADWVASTTSGLTEAQLEKMLACEFGGMSEILLDVYAVTQNERHRIAADRFYHNAVLDPLERKEDRLNGLHANTQVPKLIGEARRYELLGDAKDRSIAEFFWETVVKDHTYAMGGNSDGEHFGPPGILGGRLGTMTAETCNTYHMLKLTAHLFGWNPDACYFDYYERALYNHIRASQEPRHGRLAYFITLMPGHFRTFSTPFDSFWCCVCTGMENHVRYNEAIYFHDAADKAVYVNLYIPSRLTWKQKQLVLTQTTGYPFEDKISFSLETSAPVSATLNFRCPAWAEEGMQISVNGVPHPLDARPGSYVALQRVWNSGDKLELRIPMQLRKEAAPDNPRRIAIFHGPLMLAARLGTEGMEPPVPYAKEHTAYLQAKLTTAPVLLAGKRPLEEWIEPVNPAELTFRTKGVGVPGDVELAPFFSRYYERYTGYLDNFSPAEWEARQAAYQEEARQVAELESRTLDMVRPGVGQMERDHNFRSDKSRAGNFEGRMWRDAMPGGWFSYDLNTGGTTSCSLACLYWGGESGSRHFRITANGVTIAEQNLQNDQPGQFFRMEYGVPVEALREGRPLTVRFEGLPGNFAGGVFEVRLLRQ